MSIMELTRNIFILYTFLQTLIVFAESVEFTFELPDNAKECLHEDIDKGTETTLEYQVVTGGHYDVDVLVEGPERKILYREVKQQYGQFTFTPEVTGTYMVCFSNEFSTFSHKLIYVDFQVGDDPILPGVDEHFEAATQMETSAFRIHENLKSVIDYQTHLRLREAQSSKRAIEMNERVFFWAVGETLGILVITIGQVMVLKSFFADKK